MQQVMPYIGLIYDGIFLLLFAFAAVRSWQQGLLAGLAELAGSLLGTLGGLWGAQQMAPLLYRDLLQDVIVEQVEKALQSTGGDVAAILEHLDALPQPLRTVIDEAVGQNAASFASLPTQVAQALEPTLLPILQVVLFLLLCAVLRWACSLVVGLLRHVNGVPLVGGLNRFFGLAMGLVIGLLDCWLLSMGLWVLGCALGGRLDIFSFSALTQSAVYRMLAAWNPFLH